MLRPLVAAALLAGAPLVAVAQEKPAGDDASGCRTIVKKTTATERICR